MSRNNDMTAFWCCMSQTDAQMDTGNQSINCLMNDECLGMLLLLCVVSTCDALMEQSSSGSLSNLTYHICVVD